MMMRGASGRRAAACWLGINGALRVARNALAAYLVVARSVPAVRAAGRPAGKNSMSRLSLDGLPRYSHVVVSSLPEILTSPVTPTS